MFTRYAKLKCALHSRHVVLPTTHYSNSIFGLGLAFFFAVGYEHSCNPFRRGPPFHVFGHVAAHVRDPAGQCVNPIGLFLLVHVPRFVVLLEDHLEGLLDGTFIENHRGVQLVQVIENAPRFQNARDIEFRLLNGLILVVADERLACDVGMPLKHRSQCVQFTRV